MSLTSLLQGPSTRYEARRILDPLLPPYPTRIGAEVLVPPKCPSPQLVGTAFDYAARLELAYLAKHAEQGPWIAEKAASLPPLRSQARTRAQRIVRDARRAISRGWPRDASARFLRIATHAVALAQLDPLYRASLYVPGVQLKQTQVSKVAAEVCALMQIATPLWALAARQPLLLNPTFGTYSAGVGGADADIIAGRTVVEIKTLADGVLDRDHVRQAVGYVALACAHSIGTDRPPPTWIAFYFARQGALRRMDLPRPVAAYAAAADRLVALVQGVRTARAKP